MPSYGSGDFPASFLQDHVGSGGRNVRPGYKARQLDGSHLHSVCHVRVVGSVKQTKIQKGTPISTKFSSINMSEAELCDENI